MNECVDMFPCLLSHIQRGFSLCPGSHQLDPGWADIAVGAQLQVLAEGDQATPAQAAASGSLSSCEALPALLHPHSGGGAPCSATSLSSA